MMVALNNIILLRATKINGGMAQQPEKKTDLAVEWLHFRRNPGVKVLQISHQIF